MWVYLWVVAMEACPRSSCTTRMSTPLRSRRVATVSKTAGGSRFDSLELALDLLHYCARHGKEILLASEPQWPR